MNPWYCSNCGSKIEYWRRQDARFCSEYCRKRYYDIRKGRSAPELNKNKVAAVGKFASGLTNSGASRLSPLLDAPFPSQTKKSGVKE